jgi:hypothetical protein
METVPPLTEADLEQDLLNDTYSAYFYIGEETDVGWENAEIAFGLIPRLRIFLIKDISQITKWIGRKRPAGVVFGWKDDLHKLLTQTEADDLKTVLQEINKSRE